MKRNLKINAYIISEETHQVKLTYNIYEKGFTRLNVSSIYVDRSNLFLFRKRLLNEFKETPDLYIFDVDLPHVVRRMVINRINQYIPQNVPAVALAKNNEEEELLNQTNFPIKILIYNSENKEEREWIKDVVSNFWSSINGLK